MEEVLLLYSGGKDSLLSACYLINEGYHVNLIHYDNCSIIGTDEIQKGTNLLEKRFGKDKVTFLGIAPIISIIQRLKKLENMNLSAILTNYGDITISQYQCLICRSAMYYYSVVLAKENNIKYIAEGARKSQLFAIEQPIMIENYKRFLNNYDLQLLTPVYDITDNNYMEMELNNFGVLNCARESKCMLGYHLEEELTPEIVSGINNTFLKLIKPNLEKMMEDEIVKSPIKLLSKKLDKDYVHWY